MDNFNSDTITILQGNFLILNFSPAGNNCLLASGNTLKITFLARAQGLTITGKIINQSLLFRLRSFQNNATKTETQLLCYFTNAIPHYINFPFVVLSGI